MPYKDPRAAQACRLRYEERQRQLDPEGYRLRLLAKAQRYRNRGDHRLAQRRYRQCHLDQVRERDRQAKQAQRHQQQTELLEDFRRFVAGLPDLPFTAPQTRRQLRRLIHLALAKFSGPWYRLLPEEAASPFSARPRQLWRPLTRRGLPRNLGAR